MSNARLHIIYTDTDVFLSKRPYESWRDVQDEYEFLQCIARPVECNRSRRISGDGILYFETNSQRSGSASAGLDFGCHSADFSEPRYRRITVDTVKMFEDRLMELAPDSDSFPLEVDALLESIPSDFHENLLPSIFRFFEKFPLEDCGAPGTLVHLTEDFYPNYKGMLLSSLAQAPSCNTILMTNRILNSDLTLEEREEYQSALRAVADSNSLHPSLVEEAKRFLSYQAKRST